MRAVTVLDFGFNPALFANSSFPQVRMQQLTIDWQRVVSKARFRRLVARGDSGVSEDAAR